MPRLLTRPITVTVPEKDRAKVGALVHLAAARRRLLDAKLYLLGTAAGVGFDSEIAAVEARIDRIRLHGLGPIEPPEVEPLAVYVDPVMLAYGVDGGSSPVYVTPEGYPTVPE